MSDTNRPQRLAVLIDADNSQPSVIESLLEEVANHGVATVKRIYGDWTSPNLKGWKDVLLEYAIQPIQQFAYTRGKNATDSAMIIDAMDLLYTGTMDGFCIVSSDSDFTRLSARVREAGLIVYGFGERKTPKAFVSACDRFIYTDILRQEQPDEAPKPRPTDKELRGDSRLVNLLRNATEDSRMIPAGPIWGRWGRTLRTSLRSSILATTGSRSSASSFVRPDCLSWRSARLTTPPPNRSTFVTSGGSNPAVGVVLAQERPQVWTPE